MSRATYVVQHPHCTTNSTGKFRVVNHAELTAYAKDQQNGTPPEALFESRNILAAAEACERANAS